MNLLPTCAIVTPIYRPIPEPHEVVSITNNLSVLKDHDIFLLHPKSLNLQPYLALQKPSEKEFKFLALADENFTDIAAYNRLMISRQVYDSFSDYDYILIAQTDSYTFEDLLGAWMLLDYDYIGAPWVGILGEQQEPTLVGVGNGGFSLRKTTAFQEISLSHDFALANDAYDRLKQLFDADQAPRLQALEESLKAGYVNEDIYYSYFASSIHQVDLNIPDPVSAAHFSFELYAQHLYEEVTNKVLPFGCHSWHRSEIKFWSQFLPHPYLGQVQERE